MSKDPAAVAFGRKGGKAGTGAAKRRPPAHYRKMARARAKKRAEVITERVVFHPDEDIPLTISLNKVPRWSFTEKRGRKP
jgi:hypothetical protein